MSTPPIRLTWSVKEQTHIIYLAATERTALYWPSQPTIELRIGTVRDWRALKAAVDAAIAKEKGK